MTDVKALNNKELLNKLTFLVSEENKNVAAQIILLKEVKKRGLALELGYSGLTEFCVGKLGISRDQAWKRSQAAGVVSKEPVFLDYLKKGQTSVSALAVLAPKLSEKTSEKLRAYVPGKSKREVEAFVSNLNRDGSHCDKKRTVRVVLDLEPEDVMKLDRARKILRANKAELSYEDILSEAIDLLLDKKDPLRKTERQAQRKVKKLEAGRSEMEKLKTPASARASRTNRSSAPGKSRYVPAKVRHQVFKKMPHRCAYRAADGRQCSQTSGLSLDHIQMFCKGGEHSEENLRLLCPAHNRYLAERELGFTYLDISV